MKSTTWGFFFLASMLAAYNAHLFGHETRLKIFLTFACVEAFFMCWMDIREKKVEGATRVSKDEWLCPHCRPRVVIGGATNDARRAMIEERHMWDVHEDVMKAKLGFYE